MKPRRTWPTVLAVVAVLALTAGLLLTRLAATGPEPTPPAAPTTAVRPEPESFDPVHTQPSEESAVDAALDLAAAPQQWLYLSDTDLASAVRDIADPAAADRLADEVVSEVSLVREALRQSAGQVWWLVRPLAWRVDQFAAGRASVSVWTVSVLSAADVALPQSDWFTTTFDLRWADGQWLLVGSKDDPGPTPQLGGRDEPWQPEPFDDALDGFARVGTEAP